jgi:DNA-binding PadR family transcriptional regulator
MMSEDFDEGDAFVSYLLQNGHIEVHGVDKRGEIYYKFTEKGIKEQAEFVKDHQSVISEVVFALWEKNLMDMQMNPETNDWMGKPTELAFTDHGIELTVEEEDVLDQIKSHFLEGN